MPSFFLRTGFFVFFLSSILFIPKAHAIDQEKIVSTAINEHQRSERNLHSERRQNFLRRSIRKESVTWTFGPHKDIILGLGETIEFVNDGLHNLFIVNTLQEFEDCDFSNVQEVSPQIYTNNSTEEVVYFVCTIRGHCPAGNMKVKVFFMDISAMPSVVKSESPSPVPTLINQASPSLAPSLNNSESQSTTTSPTSAPQNTTITTPSLNPINVPNPFLNLGIITSLLSCLP